MLWNMGLKDAIPLLSLFCKRFLFRSISKFWHPLNEHSSDLRRRSAFYFFHIRYLISALSFLLSSTCACLQYLCANSPKFVGINAVNASSAQNSSHYISHASTVVWDHEPERLDQTKIQSGKMSFFPHPNSVTRTVYPDQKLSKSKNGL